MSWDNPSDHMIIPFNVGESGLSRHSNQLQESVILVGRRYDSDEGSQRSTPIPSPPVDNMSSITASKVPECQPLRSPLNPQGAYDQKAPQISIDYLRKISISELSESNSKPCLDCSLKLMDLDCRLMLD
jgi:hypothetical protein